MDHVTVAAVDLGASSGRVMLGRVRSGGPRPMLDLREVHRFANGPVELATHAGSGLHWDVLGLYREVLVGLRAARAALDPGEVLAGIGIDSWAVDYGLLDSGGELVGTPYCYRDRRTAAGVAAVHAVVPHARLYPRNGLQFLPFNTLYQLAAEPPERLERAAAMLLVPDLLAFWLTGELRAEATNASTTGLLDVAGGGWDLELAQRLSLPASILPPLVRSGDVTGRLLPSVAQECGLPQSTPVVAVGSHDTASAVVGVPAADDEFAYISCGTWSLVGLELAAPVLTEASRAANFTNEAGVDGTIRYLRNVMGLWLVSESLRSWELAGSPVALAPLLEAAAALPPGGPVVDPDDPVFLPPGDLPARVENACRATGQRPPADRPALIRCLLDSLAAAYARATDDAQRLSGRRARVLHVVGGGSRNDLLCRLTARSTGLPVLAGPVEATALGNVLVQARALGALDGDLGGLRSLLRATQTVRPYPPDAPAR